MKKSSAATEETKRQEVVAKPDIEECILIGKKVGKCFKRVIRQITKSLLTLLVIMACFSIISQNPAIEKQYPILFDIACGTMNYANFAWKAICSLLHCIVTFRWSNIFGEVSQIVKDFIDLTNQFFSWVSTTMF